MNKLINCPKGAAGEYAQFAMSFYEGCVESDKQCDYCYMKAMSNRFGSYFGKARLKAWLKDEENALGIFIKEVNRNIPKLQKSGLFFNFSSDPFLPQAFELNFEAWKVCNKIGIPVYILTKQKFPKFGHESIIPKNVRIGYTLTGRDDKENGATATNKERALSMAFFHALGYKTFGSFEPIIDFGSTLKMVDLVKDDCDLFKIGLKSGDKYHFEEIRDFLDEVFELVPEKPIYLKDSLLKQAGITRDSIDLPENCVTRDFNL